jgi:ribonuclease BN (tRNA processing enzyme)
VLLTVLGCSGSAPGPGAPGSGYLLEADGFVLAIELGNGTLAELPDPFALDAIVFSHLHPDHCADFSALTVLRRYHPRAPTGRLPVYAPSEAPTRFAAAYCPSEAERIEADLTDVFAFHPLGPGDVHIGPFAVTASKAAHPCEAFSFRFTHGGRSLVYTGDTGPLDSLDTLAEGADVLLAEASWTHTADRPPDLHLSGIQAGALAATAGVGRLLLTHVTPWTDPADVLTEARTSYPAAALARQGAVYEI